MTKKECTARAIAIFTGRSIPTQRAIFALTCLIIVYGTLAALWLLIGAPIADWAIDTTNSAAQ